MTGHVGIVDALLAGDVRAVAAAMLRREHRPYRAGMEALEVAVRAAGDLTARSLAGGDVEAARIYAGAWELLNDREMRGYARRTRDRAATRP